MTLRKRLYAIFGAVALASVAVSLTGYLLASLFAVAIYEIGVVRLPSIASLETMEEASRVLARESRRERASAPGGDAARAATQAKARAWERFDHGIAVYAPLPQTPQEAEIWASLRRHIEEWKREDADLERRRLEPQDGPAGDGVHAADQQGLSRARRAIRQIQRLRIINEEVARETTDRTVATLEDARNVQSFMFGLGLLALAVNLSLAWLLNRSIARPISEAEKVIRRITDGDLSARAGAGAGADDETGHLIESVNRLAERLQNSEAARQAIGANLPRSIIYQAVYDPVTGPRFVYVSPNVEQITGVSPKALFEDAGLLDRMVREEDRRALQDARAAVLSSGKPLEVTVRGRNAEGRMLDLHITSATRALPDGSIVSDGVITDVTDRAEAERRTATLARTLRTLSRCRHAVVHATDEQTLLQEVCDAIAEDENYPMVRVAYRVDDEQKSVRTMARAGISLDFDIDRGTRWSDTDLGRGAIGTAIRTGTVQVIEDARTDPRFAPWRRYAERFHVGSVLAFPLKDHGETFATLVIYTSVREVRIHDEVRILQDFAEDLEFGLGALRARRRLEESIRDLAVSEERFRSAMSQSPIGMSISALDGRWIEVNEALCQITGYSREELLQTDFQSITHPDDVEKDVANAAALVRGELPWFRMEKRYIRKDGRITWAEIHVSVIPDSEGRPLHFVAQVIDVTERRKAEEASQVSRTRLRLAAEVAGLYYWEYRADTRLFHFEGGTNDLFRAVDDSVDPVDLDEFIRDYVVAEDGPRVRAEFTKALREADPHRFQNSEYRIRRGDGTTGTVSVNYLVERDAAGQAVLARGAIQDITEKEKLREQLAQVQKMEAVGQLAGGVAHDFNNFLTVILGYGQILTSSLDPSDRRHTMAAQIVDAAERSASLTAQLLAFSRREVLAPKVLDLNEVVRGIEKMLRRLLGEDVALRIALDAGPATVRADPAQLQQLLVNLAVNARDAMPRGGNLAIETSLVDLPEPRVSRYASIPAGRYVRLVVRDSGTGIPEDVQKQMFEPFYTTKGHGQGTGLGLAVVYGVVRQSGAFIEVESRPGAGAAFLISFPDGGPAEVDDLAADDATPPPRGDETVLLVEDEDAIRGLCSDALTAAGYCVLIAHDGEDALEVARRHDGGIDLLVTDVVMPRLGGAELARRLKDARPALKVLFVSGYTDDAVLKQGIRRREVAFLQKPFRMAALLRTVRGVLDQD